MTAVFSTNANEYVRGAAEKLQGVISNILRVKQTVSANDIRTHATGRSFLVNGTLLPTERAAAITLAFRMAGLVKTSIQVPNSDFLSRGRKVSVWARPASN